MSSVNSAKFSSPLSERALRSLRRTAPHSATRVRRSSTSSASLPHRQSSSSAAARWPFFAQKTILSTTAKFSTDFVWCSALPFAFFILIVSRLRRAFKIGFIFLCLSICCTVGDESAFSSVFVSGAKTIKPNIVVLRGEALLVYLNKISQTTTKSRK